MFKLKQFDSHESPKAEKSKRIESSIGDCWVIKSNDDAIEKVIVANGPDPRTEARYDEQEKLMHHELKDCHLEDNKGRILEISSIEASILPRTWEFVSGVKRPTTKGEPVNRFHGQQTGLNIDLRDRATEIGKRKLPNITKKSTSHKNRSGLTIDLTPGIEEKVWKNNE